MSVIGKIKEAMFFYQKINDNYTVFPDVQYYFNAFLNSCFSIPAHLLEDYNKKYNLGITLNNKLTVKDFKQKAKELNKTDALEFISRYSQKLKTINSTTLGQIISKKRHETTHRQSVEVEDFATLMWSEFTPKDRIEQIKLANPQLPKTVIHTEEMAYVEIADCQHFIDSIIAMVSEAIEKFPNDLLDVKV
jgi:hypothetical protein